MRRPNQKTPPRSREAGVTLIEMMVVLVIIAVVAALIVPNVIGRPDEARVTVARTDLRAINRNYPTTDQGLAALVRAPSDAVNWASGGYLTELPTDPWGNPYLYEVPGVLGPFDLISLGADGAPGGTGTDADISRHVETAGN